MKSEKLVLKIDIIIQVLLMVSVPVIYFVTKDGLQSFVLFYFALGGWQLLSFLVQIKRRENMIKSSWYSFYAKTILLLLVIGLICLLLLAVEMYLPLFGYLIMMLFSGIILAFIYLKIEISDYKNMKYE